MTSTLAVNCTRKVDGTSTAQASAQEVHKRSAQDKACCSRISRRDRSGSKWEVSLTQVGGMLAFAHESITPRDMRVMLASYYVPTVGT